MRRVDELLAAPPGTPSRLLPDAGPARHFTYPRPAWIAWSFLHTAVAMEGCGMDYETSPRETHWLWGTTERTHIMARARRSTSIVVPSDGAGLSHIKVTRVASVEDTARAVGEAAVQSIYRTGAAILAMETRVHGVLVETEAKLREALA